MDASALCAPAGENHPSIPAIAAISSAMRMSFSIVEEGCISLSFMDDRMRAAARGVGGLARIARGRIYLPRRRHGAVKGVRSADEPETQPARAPPRDQRHSRGALQRARL